MASSPSSKDTEKQEVKEVACLLCTGGKWVPNRRGNRKYVGEDIKIRTVWFYVARKNLTLEVLEDLVRNRGILETDKPFILSYFRAVPGKINRRKRNRYIATDLTSDHDCEGFVELVVNSPLPLVLHHSLKN